MVVTRNMDAGLEALEKAMEEQASRLAAIKAKLDKWVAIQKSLFDLILQQFVALGSLLGHKELTFIPAAVECLHQLPLPSHCNNARHSIQPSVSAVSALIAAAHMVPYIPTVLPPQPPNLPFPLQQSSPLPSMQQLNVSIRFTPYHKHHLLLRCPILCARIR